MKTHVIALSLLLSGISVSRAQLTNGSTAPDFTLTDINGTTHHLYDYLDAGKTVYLDFFAAHCPTCWNYKNSGNMSNLYTSYGPNGSDEIMIIAIELDANNGYDELHGIAGFTQGDWTTSPYPIVNPEGTERSTIISAYAANFYPLIYGICPNRSVNYLGTTTTANLYNYHTSDCGPLGIPENENSLFFKTTDETVLFSSNGAFTITDLSGRILLNEQAVVAGSELSLSDFHGGVYILSFSHEGQLQTTTLFRQ